MHELIETIRRWRAEGQPIALATVVRVIGSAPRPPGARLAVSAAGQLAGSVSAGCVEGAVAEACLETLAGGASRLLSFGISDEQAWEVGLACGGAIEVLVEPLDWRPDQLEPALLGALEHGRPVVLATLLSGPAMGAHLLLDPAGERLGTLGDAALDAAVAAEALALLEHEDAQVRPYPPAEVFIESLLPPPHLVIVGAVHIAMVLCTCAKALGFRVSVVDPRPSFASAERFPQADALIVEWPDQALPQLGLGRSSYVAVLTHDPKLDDPAITSALRLPLGYLGAIGSRSTQERRQARLREQGLSDEQLARLHGPIGLPLGGRSPGEIAISILAEIIAVRNQQTL